MIKHTAKKALPLLILITILFQPRHLHALEVSAPSAILMDAKTGEILYEKNSNAQRAIASTTKIMTYLLTMEAIDEGNIALTDRVKVSKNAAQTGGSSYSLKENDVLTVSELINSMMVISANDSAVVLAEHVSGSLTEFVLEMNKKARSLGLETAYFVNPNGMPLANKDQNKMSAKDLALLSKYVINTYEDQLIQITSQKQFTGTYKNYSKKNTNQLLTTTPFTDGLKTGYTDLAMHCLVSRAKVKDSKGDEGRIISVILGGQSSSQRFTDSQKMLEYGLHNDTVEGDIKAELEAIIEPITELALEATPGPQIAIFINGDQLMCDPTNPFIQNGTTLVPLSKIADQLGGEIAWEPSSKTIIGKKDNTSFMLTINNKEAIINGTIIDLATPPIITQGATMVPIKFIAQSLGMDVKWESGSRTIIISNPGY